MSTQIQQGDCLLQRVEVIPDAAKRIKPKGGRHVLAEGEVTNHCHAIAAKGTNLFMLDARMFVEVKARTQVVHEEHKPVTLVPGVYEVTRVQEYDYLTQMVNPVRD